MDKRVEELAKHAQGKPSEVRGDRNLRLYQNSPVNKSEGSVWHKGDRIAVVNGMVFKNGTYQGPAPK